jgi:hypothetical protein
MGHNLRKRLDAVQRMMMTSTNHGAHIRIVFDPNFYGNAERLEQLMPGWSRRPLTLDAWLAQQTSQNVTPTSPNVVPASALV